MHIIILYYLLMVTCHSQGGSYNSVSLNTTNKDISGAKIVQILDGDWKLMGSRVFNGQWEVVPLNDYSYFALQLTVFKDNNWHFNPRVPSFLRFTMYGPPTTETTDESSLLLTFSDFLPETMYFTALIQLEGTPRFNNKISTGCDTSDTPTTLFSRGTAIKTTNAYGNASLRREKAGFSSSYTDAAYDWEPSQNGATADYPITFLISNYPNLNQTTIQLTTPTYTQQCNFGEAFTTGETLAFAFSGDLANQTLFFNKFDVESWYNFTDNPTAVPTQAPTSPSQIPTQSTTDPSASPTRYPSSNPTMTPTAYPSKTPTDQPSGHPSPRPSDVPSQTPSAAPTQPTTHPSVSPTRYPSSNPTITPTADPSKTPTHQPSMHPSTSPSRSPTRNPTLAPTRGLEYIEGLWSDDLYFIDQVLSPDSKYGDSLYDQGWVLYNGGLTPNGEFLTLMDPDDNTYARELYHLTTNKNASHLLWGTQLMNKRIKILTNQSGSTWYGPFQMRMLLDSNTYSHINQIRNFQCGTQGVDETYTLTIQYTVWWCRPKSYGDIGWNSMSHKLYVYEPFATTTLFNETVDVSVTSGEMIPVETTSELSCSPDNRRRMQTVEVTAPTLMPSSTKFRVWISWMIKRADEWAQHKDVQIRCRPPSSSPTMDPTADPTIDPTLDPTRIPTSNPSKTPSIYPTRTPTTDPSRLPTTDPTVGPTKQPTTDPTSDPTRDPTKDPTVDPTVEPTTVPTAAPSTSPSLAPSSAPSLAPSLTPSLSPSRAPSQPPTLAPSLSPSLAPSLAPTYSPTTCFDYPRRKALNESYPPVDGADYVIDVAEYMARTRTALGTDAVNTTVTDVAGLHSQTFTCNNTNGCAYECLNIASCIFSIIHCKSDKACNIKCETNLACGELVIYANDAASSMALHVECHKEACQRAKIYVSNITSAHIHCYELNSCQDIEVHFDHTSTLNNTNTSVTCYSKDACTNLHIIADGRLTQLRMYEHSHNIILDNGYGWAFDEDTITCDLHSKFIRYEFDTSDPDAQLDTLIRAEYTDAMLPCEGIVVKCVNTKPDGTPFDGTCQMKYELISSNTFENLRKSYPVAFGPEQHCVYISIDDMTNLQCAGDCQGSPTNAPTAAPSASPTQPPTLAPTLAPTLSPSDTPTQPPTFSPSDAPTISPTVAPTSAPSMTPTTPPTAAPSIAPTYSPTRAPSHSPTDAPSRAPTTAQQFKAYDGYTAIVYRFENMTIEDCVMVHNYTGTKYATIEKMQEIIESNYWHPNYLPEFKIFRIEILKINKINYQDTNKFKLAVLTDGVINSINPIELHVASKIHFEWEFADHFTTTSNSPTFWNSTSIDFREYFGNDYLNFTVANASSISATPVGSGDDIDWAFWIFNSMLLVCVLVGLAARVHTRSHHESVHDDDDDRTTTGSSKTSGGWGVPVDNVRWWAIAYYGLQIYDVISDINLTTEIFIVMSNREGGDPTKAWADDGNKSLDDPNKLDTPQEWALVICGWLSAIFLIVPYFLNVAYASKIPGHSIMRNNNSARIWMEQYQTMFITLVVFSGGCYPALLLCSSNLFGISLLNAGLSTFELTHLSDVRVYTTVLTENGPQLIVQILYAWAIGKVSLNTGLAMWTSIMSILSSILNYFMNKDKAGCVEDIYYYFEMKLKASGGRLTPEQKKYICKRKGIKMALEKKICKLYGLDVVGFEVGFVAIRNDNLVIRIIQHLHEGKLSKERQYEMEQYEADYAETKLTIQERDAKIYRLFQQHCYDTYLMHKGEVENIIFGHYGELDRTKFNLRYHQEYPKERRDMKHMKGDAMDALIRVAAEKGGGGATSHDPDWLSSDDSQLLLSDDDYEAMNDWERDYVRTRRYRNESIIRRRKRKKKRIGGELAELEDYRRQFKKASLILRDEVHKIKESRFATISAMNITDFSKTLGANRIDRGVITDLLKYALLVGMFETEKENDEQGKEDPAQKELMKRRALSKQIEIQPAWFPHIGDNPHYKQTQLVPLEAQPSWFPHIGDNPHYKQRHMPWLDKMNGNDVEEEENDNKRKKRKKRKKKKRRKED